MYACQEEPICKVWFSISLSLTPCGLLCIKILNISIKHPSRKKCVYGCHLQGHAIVDSDSCFISNSGRRDLYLIPTSIAHFYIQMNTDFVFPALSTRKRNWSIFARCKKEYLSACFLLVTRQIIIQGFFLVCVCVFKILYQTIPNS